MSSVEQEPLPRALKEKVKTVLNPYFTKNYNEDVKNPVLLLNYLHQHSVIPKPVYDVRPDPDTPFHFIGSCSVGPLNPEDYNVSHAVGPLKAEVDANSKKKCKTKAAQIILDLFLEDDEMDVINYCDDPGYEQISLGVQSMSIEGSSSEESIEYRCSYETTGAVEDAGKFYEDDLSGCLYFDQMILDPKTKSKDNERKKSLKSHLPADLTVFYVEPQCGVDMILKSSASDEETKSLPLECAAEKCISDKDSKTHDPCTNRNRAIKTESILPGTSVEEQNMPARKSESQSNSVASKRLSWEKTTDSSASSQSSNQSSDDQRILLNDRSLVGDNLFVNFFDPFSRLRPKINGLVNGGRKENGMLAGKGATNGEPTNCEAQPKFPAELIQSNKTPFQILQEKAVKNFKLIPRSRIEKTENGFSCTLILDAHTGCGEGRTKKEAKLKAATCLLQLLEDLQ